MVGFQGCPPRRCPGWVMSVVLVVDRLLPVYPNEQTFVVFDGVSQTGPEADLQGFTRSLYDLSGIHNVVRIERALERSHYPDRSLPKLRNKEMLLALANPVFAGTGSVRGDRQLR